MQCSAHRWNQPTNLEGIRSSRTCHQILEVLTGRGGWLLGFVSTNPSLEKTAASLKFWRIFVKESSPKFKYVCWNHHLVKSKYMMATVTQDVRFRSLIHLKISSHFWKVFFVSDSGADDTQNIPKNPSYNVECQMVGIVSKVHICHLCGNHWVSSLSSGKNLPMGFHDFNELASGIPITCVSSQGTIWGFCLCHSASCELRDLGDVCATHPGGWLDQKIFWTKTCTTQRCSGLLPAMFKVQVSIQFPVSWAKSISNSQTAVLYGLMLQTCRLGCREVSFSKYHPHQNVPSSSNSFVNKAGKGYIPKSPLDLHNFQYFHRDVRPANFPSQLNPKVMWTKLLKSWKVLKW